MDQMESRAQKPSHHPLKHLRRSCGKGLARKISLGKMLFFSTLLCENEEAPLRLLKSAERGAALDTCGDCGVVCTQGSKGL